LHPEYQLSKIAVSGDEERAGLIGQFKNFLIPKSPEPNPRCSLRHGHPLQVVRQSEHQRFHPQEILITGSRNGMDLIGFQSFGGKGKRRVYPCAGQAGMLRKNLILAFPRPVSPE